MYGDPAAIRALARETAQLADEAHAEASRVRAAREVAWVSAGADRYRDWLDDQGGRVDRAAAELEQAADALYRHAREVEDRLAWLESLARKVLP